MQDISKHINECIELNENVGVLESTSLVESNDLDVLNESELGDISYKAEPIERRKYVLNFLRKLFEKQGWDKEGATNSAMYRDMNLWNVTQYVPHILKIVFKNNKKAVELFTPLFKLIDGLYNYSDAHIKDGNELFTKMGTIDKQNALNVIKNAEIKAYLNDETGSDEWTVLGVMVWGESLQGLKATDDEVTKALKPLKKLYDKFELINQGKRDMVMVTGTSKAYLKELKELNKKWIKKIESENK